MFRTETFFSFSFFKHSIKEKLGIDLRHRKRVHVGTEFVAEYEVGGSARKLSYLGAPQFRAVADVQALVFAALGFSVKIARVILVR